MATFTRKALSAMGIESDKIDQIIEMHTDVTDGMKEQIGILEKEVKTYKADAEKLPTVQKELDELKAQVDADTKAREGKDYDKLKQEFDDYKADVAKKAVRASKEAAYKEVLKDAGVPEKHWAKIIKYSDVDSVELDDKGKITTAKDLLKSIKEDWGDHIETKQQEGTPTPTPPANDGGKGKTREEILAIKNYSDKQKAIAENHELFGF